MFIFTLCDGFSTWTHMHIKWTLVFSAPIALSHFALFPLRLSSISSPLTLKFFFFDTLSLVFVVCMTINAGLFTGAWVPSQSYLTQEYNTLNPGNN